MIPLKNSIIKDSDKLNILSSSLSPKNKENNIGNTVRRGTPSLDGWLFFPGRDEKYCEQNNCLKTCIKIIYISIRGK